MMEPRLHRRLAPLERMRCRARLWRKLAVCWTAAAVGALLLFLCAGPWSAKFLLVSILPFAGAAAAAIIIATRESRRPGDYRALAAAVERDHPETRHLFSAAVEQEPNPDSGGFGYLQSRVIEQVLTHSGRASWERKLHRHLSRARYAHAGSLAASLIVIWALGKSAPREQSVLGAWFSKEISVSPGDIEVERGTTLVISARFGQKPPAEATLVLTPTSGAARRVPMLRQLADPVLGTRLLEFAENTSYHIEYGSRKTRDYRIAVFDYPELVQADAGLVFPEYTRLTNRVVSDTRRISAVEGTRLTYTLKLNKPVARARFVQGTQSLPLAVSSNALALLEDFQLARTARYSLELVDAEGRTNKVPADFSIQVLTNRRPELKLAFPRGDPRVSKLEELQLEAQAADDFGLLKYGVGVGVVGQNPQFVPLGEAAPANEKRQLSHLIPLEKLGVEVDQVVSYFVWADDYGPDGQVRRTLSDIFFAEIRPFEEIFRRDQSGGAGGSSQGQQSGEAAQLAQLQKEIVIATWKLQQEKPGAIESKVSEQ